MNQVLNLNLSDEQIQHLTYLQKQLTAELENNSATQPSIIPQLQNELREILTKQAGFDKIEQLAHYQELTLTLIHPSTHITNLPWQLAVEDLPNLFLLQSNKTTLASTPPQYGYPLKILVMVSAPEGATPLNFETEEAQLLEAFAPLMEAGLAQVHFTDDGSLEDLEHKLRNNHYHILHFSGHGVYDEREKTGFLLLEDSTTGQAKKTTAIGFNKILEATPSNRPELVVLSACQTAQSHVSGETSSVADTLLRGGQQAVVAMSASILDNCATHFAARFYQFLAKEEPLAMAFSKACKDLQVFENKMFNRHNRPASQWLIPQLLVGCDMSFIANHDKPTQRLNFKEDTQYITGQKDLLNLRNRPEGYVFIGRRKDRQAVFPKLLNGKAQLLRGQGGVGKTAFAEHLTIRLMAFSQHYKPFVLSNYIVNDSKTNQQCNWELPLIADLRDYLIAENQFDAIIYTDKKSLNEKLDYLLPEVEALCQPLFIFDNIESFQDLKSGAWKTDEYAHILETLTFLYKKGKNPIIITGRFPIPELPDLEVKDLNTASFTDFYKKCQYLPLSNLAENPQPSSRNTPIQGVASVPFIKIVRLLHEAFGGNYRALEFFNTLYIERGMAVVFGTLHNLEQLKASLKGAVEEVRQDMSKNLVFNELLQLLSPKELDSLQVLAHFNIPVLSKAVSMQRSEADFEAVLHRLADLTLAERSAFNDFTWFYVMPLVKGILKDLKLFNVLFGEKEAGDYHDFIDENIEKSDKNNAIEAFYFYKNCQDTEGVNKVGHELCRFYHEVQQYRESLSYAMQTDTICGEATDSRIWNNMGMIFQILGELDKAFMYFQKALTDFEKNEIVEGEALILNNISQIYSEKGDYGTSLKYLERSLSIMRKTNDRKNEGLVLNNIGQIYLNRGDYDTALSYFEKSLAIRKEINDIRGEGTNLNNIGQIYGLKGNYSKALDNYKAGLAIMKKIGNRQAESSALNNIGQIHAFLGNYDDALHHLKESLAIVQKLGDCQREAIFLNNIHEIYSIRGDYDAAMRYLKSSLKIQQQIGDRQNMPTTLNNIGRLYLAQDEFDAALPYLEEGLKISRDLGDRKNEGIILTNLSAFFLGIEDYDKALESLDTSLSILEDVGDRRGLCTTLHNMATIYYEYKDDEDKFLEYEDRAFQIATEIGNAEGLYHIGRTYGATLCQIGNKEKGLFLLQKALEIGRKVGFPDAERVAEAIQHFEKD